MISPDDRKAGRLVRSRAMIDVCRPYGRIDTFPAVAQTSPELVEEVRAKFPMVFSC